MTKYGLLAAIVIANAAHAQESTLENVEQITQEATSQESQVASQTLDAISVQGSTDLTEMSQDTKKLFKTPGAGNDPLVALQALPGIVSGSDLGGEPAVRGSSPEDNTYQVDNLPVGYLFHILGYSIFSDNVVQNFDLQTGAFGAQYGGATGASIDVSLRQPKKQPLETSIDLGMFNSGIFIESGIGENQSFYLGYRHSTISLFAPLITGDDAADEENGFKVNKFPNSDDFYGKYHWQVNEDNELNVFVTAAKDSVGVEFLEGSEATVNEPELDGSAIAVDIGFVTSGLTWQHKTQSGNELTTSLGNLYTIEHATLGKDAYSDLVINTYFADIDYTAFNFDDHEINMGIELSKGNGAFDMDVLDSSNDEVTPDQNYSNGRRVVVDDNQDVVHINAYLQDNWYVNNQLVLTPGVHVSYDDFIKDSIVQPRFKAQYTTYNDTEFFVAAGKHHQMPHMDELLPAFGNPELKNIEANHYVTGIEKQFFQGWSAKGEAYYKSLTGFPLGNDTNQYTNDVSGEAYGLELLIEKEKTNKLSGWLAVSLSKSERTNEVTGDTTAFDLDKPVVIDAVANYDLNEKWNMGLRWSLKSGNLYTPVLGGIEYDDNPGFYYADYGKYNSERLPMEHRLDVRFEYNKVKPNSKLTYYIDILNAYNQKNVQGISYTSDFSEQEEKTDGIPILPLIGVKYTF